MSAQTIGTPFPSGPAVRGCAAGSVGKSSDEMISHAFGRRRRVLVLGGWSPGPLDVLRSRFHSEIEFEEPDIPMPPAGCRWCVNPCWILLITLLVFTPWLLIQAEDWAGTDGGSWGIRIALVVGFFVLLRLLIAGVVWFSVRDSMRIACANMDSFGPDLLLGFSWGGGIASWLIAERKWTGPAILLAPTVRAVGRVACMRRARLSQAGDCSQVHVFHADGDPFCPDVQVQDFSDDGCEVHRCNDEHVLLQRGTVEQIAKCLQELLMRQARPAE